MSKSTISIFELIKQFPNEPSGRKHLEGIKWANGKAICPDCNSSNIYIRKGKREGQYDCRDCERVFNVKTHTIFEGSHIKLEKWIYGIYILMTSRKGISSLQLSKQIGITQKSAWFMLQRLRQACGSDMVLLKGIIEIDETYIGGKERNKHTGKRLHAGRGAVGKQAVLGMRERGGNLKVMPVSNTSKTTLQSKIHASVALGSTIYTDEHGGYAGLAKHSYNHQSIKHSLGIYVDGDCNTNSIESAWAVLKRGIYGTYHHVSPKHLGRYLSEAAFRLNEGNVENHVLDRIDSLLNSVVGKRITYKVLTQ